MNLQSRITNFECGAVFQIPNQWNPLNYYIFKQKLDMPKFDLQDRLIDFSVDLIKLLDNLPSSIVGKHLKGQLTKSGTSPALNYAEACDAESRKDFIHKIKIVLKELRETSVGITIIKRLDLLDLKQLNYLLRECDELIAILKRSHSTAKANLEKAKMK